MDDNKRQTIDKESTYVLIEDLRQLRKDAQRLNSSLVKRLRPFKKKNGSFKTLPKSREKQDSPGRPDISVASTCTVLMAALLAGEKARKSLFDTSSAMDVFKKSVVNANWGSSGLTDGNAFTTAIVIRCAGFVVNAGVMEAKAVTALRHRRFPDNEGVGSKTLAQIARAKAKNPAKAFAVEEYPAKSTHAYWFVDGVISTHIGLELQSWKKIAAWASNEFHRQAIYVSAGNDALMDPPSLAMAACLISRIKRFSMSEPRLAAVSRQLPSTLELQFGVQQVFAKQSDSGIWYRYFPLFHFPKGQGAADYCFSFEFLEAILVEFGHYVLKDSHLLQRITRIIEWCDKHELVFTDGDKEYRGWNSGGEVRKLADGQSESWATASVHMFLTQLESKINDVLDDLTLKFFGFDRTAVVKSTTKFDDMVDASLKFPGERQKTLKTVIQRDILDPIKKLDRNREKLIQNGLPVPRSALLFGPPGTSKSRLAKAMAEYLGWPLITITPSEFLGKGLEQVHAQVDARFRDLMDLRRVVVFFDEMDALAQTREGEDLPEPSPARDKTTKEESPDLDVTRQLLTTSMLPKLASLWDQDRVIFLMATNHKRQLDPAITRPNRFDLLLCVAPPQWKNKRKAKSLSATLGVAEEDAAKIERELARLAPDDSAASQSLDYFTIAEIGIFLYHLRKSREITLLNALEQFESPDGFREAVERWAKDSITLRTTESPTRSEFLQDFKESRRQYFPGQR